MDKQLELLQGTLDMLILKAVSLGPLHGYGVLLRIQQISKNRLEIQQGSLYPALYRLEHQGWIASEWGESENKRKAKYYRLTTTGKRRLQTETDKWNRMAEVIAGILNARPGGSMRFLARVRSWRRSLFGREGAEREMDAELRSRTSWGPACISRPGGRSSSLDLGLATEALPVSHESEVAEHRCQ